MAHSQDTTQFLSVCTLDELAVFLGYPNYAVLSALIYPVPFYRTFSLRKKTGGIRIISAPALQLKNIQFKISKAMSELDRSRDSVHGFRKKRSVSTNAKAHAYGKKGFVFNLDLETFFNTISFKRVRGLFQSKPFNFPLPLATVLAHISCKNGALPQGAPTSPVISNFICRALDGDLQRLAKTCRSTYTRYADDLTFSFSRRARTHLPEEIIAAIGSPSLVGIELEKIISKHGFAINQKKVRLQYYGYRMEVTGLTVNEAPNVRRKYIDEIRGMLHAWKKYGLKAATATFETRPYSRQLRSTRVPAFENYLRGKLCYLKMIKGLDDPVYVKLGRKFNELVISSQDCRAQVLLIADTVIEESEVDSAVYIIRCIDEENLQESQGTAFFLSQYGIITCEHVVRFPAARLTDEDKNLPNGYFGFTMGKIYIEDSAGRTICEAHLEKVCEQADVAILTPSTTPTRKILSLTGEKMPIKKGESLSLVGFPDHTKGKGLSIVRGHVTNIYPRSGISLFDINEQIQKGNSGGPVINSQLKVVGIAMEGQRDMIKSNAVVNIEMLDRLIKSGHLVSPSTTAVDISMPPNDPVKKISLWEKFRGFIRRLKKFSLVKE